MVATLALALIAAISVSTLGIGVAGMAFSTLVYVCQREEESVVRALFTVTELSPDINCDNTVVAIATTQCKQ